MTGDPTKITTPCHIDGMSAETYHGDPCDAPALGHSGAHKLIERCPAYYWANSPLNPDFEREEKTQFDLGHAAHLILLEPDVWPEQIVIIDAPDYRKKDAQEARDGARVAGKTPLLRHQYEEICAMSRALYRDPVARQAIRGGVAERSYFAKDPATGVWIKARPDYERHGMLIDYKTTTNAHPALFKRRIYDMGHFTQDPWYRNVVEIVTGERPREFWFVVQEIEPPYLVSCGRLSERAVEWGRIHIRAAIDLFAQCLERQEWPGYRDPATPHKDTAFVYELPVYAEYQLRDRHEAGEFAPPKPATMAERRNADLMFEPL